jgi:hypothetical protein
VSVQYVDGGVLCDRCDRWVPVEKSEIAECEFVFFCSKECAERYAFDAYCDADYAADDARE